MFLAMPWPMNPRPMKPMVSFLVAVADIVLPLGSRLPIAPACSPSEERREKATRDVGGWTETPLPSLRGALATKQSIARRETGGLTHALWGRVLRPLDCFASLAMTDGDMNTIWPPDRRSARMQKTFERAHLWHTVRILAACVLAY